MPNRDKYFDTSKLRAEKAWSRIQEKPTSILIVRGKSLSLAEQTVRLEYGSAQRERKGDDDAKSSMRNIVVYGVQGHPTIPDTNIKRNDRFAVNGQVWRIEDVVYVIGGIQANGVAVS